MEVLWGRPLVVWLIGILVFVLFVFTLPWTLLISVRWVMGVRGARGTNDNEFSSIKGGSGVPWVPGDMKILWKGKIELGDHVLDWLLKLSGV